MAAPIDGGLSAGHARQRAHPESGPSSSFVRSRRRAAIYGLLEKQFKLITTRPNKQPGRARARTCLAWLECASKTFVVPRRVRVGRNQSRQFVRPTVKSEHQTASALRAVDDPFAHVRKGRRVQCGPGGRDDRGRHNVRHARTAPSRQWLEAEAASQETVRDSRSGAERHPVREQLIVALYLK